jgi:hypothetical protein
MALSCSKDLQTFYPPVPYFEFAISRIAPWEHIVDFALVDIEVTPWEKHGSELERELERGRS